MSANRVVGHCESKYTVIMLLCAYEYIAFNAEGTLCIGF